MKKTPLILMLLFFCSFAYADIKHNDTDLLVWLKLDMASGNAVDSKANQLPQLNFTYVADGGTDITYQAAPLSFQTGTGNYSNYWNGCGGDCDGWTSTAINDYMGGVNSCRYTMSFWQYNVNMDASGHWLVHTGNTASAGFQLVHDGGNLNYLYYGSTTASVSQAVGTSKAYYFVSIVLNSTCAAMFINGTLKQTDCSYACDNQRTSATPMYIVNVPAQAAYGATDVYIDEFTIINRSLSAQEINNLYLNGINTTGVTPAAPGTENFTFREPTPADNDRNSVYDNVQINGTCSGTASVNLFWNGVFIKNGTSQANFTLNSSLVTAEGKYNYSGNCDGNTNTTRTWYYDTTSPSIVLVESSSSFNAQNITSNIYATLFKINLSLYDNLDLFAVAFNVTHPNGTAVFSYTNLSLDGTSANVYVTADSSGWCQSRMTFNVTIWASDSHTNNNIGNYKPKQITNGIEFTTEEGNIITIEAEESAGFTAWKQGSDRYSFSVNFLDDKEKKRGFFITANNPIYIKDSTSIPGHFVISAPGQIGGNWLDFDGANSIYTVTRLSDNIVFISFDKLKDATFNSVGGLNVNTVTYYYTQDKLVNYQAISQYVQYQTANYTRNLSYAINLSCLSGYNSSLAVVISNKVNSTQALTCTNQSQLYTGSFKRYPEGNYTFSLFFNTTYNAANLTRYFLNGTYASDLYNPTVIANFTIPHGFALPRTNVSLQCKDTVSVILTYNATFNGVMLQYENRTNGTILRNETTLSSGANNLNAVCYDFFGQTEYSINRSAYFTEMCLIDERLNTYFNASNLSVAKAYFDDNSSSFDYKINTNTSCVNLTTYKDISIRVELKEYDGEIHTRYVNPRLLANSSRICANSDDVQHYEQIIISATAKDVVLKSLYANCDVAADSTRFAYQDALILKAHTIDTQYYLYTYDGGERVYLASVDGSLASYINLDIIEFNRDSSIIDIASEALTVREFGSNTLQIYYKNLDEDNNALGISIINLNTNENLFSTSDFTNLNEFTIYFNYATTANLSNSTIFKIQLNKTDATGYSEIVKYFNMQGQTGIFHSGFAFTLAVLLTIFGLTFTVARLELSFFGIFCIIGSIIILAMGVSTWYIIFFQVINAIILIYAFINMINQNYPTLT